MPLEFSELIIPNYSLSNWPDVTISKLRCDGREAGEAHVPFIHAATSVELVSKLCFYAASSRTVYRAAFDCYANSSDKR